MKVSRGCALAMGVFLCGGALLCASCSSTKDAKELPVPTSLMDLKWLPPATAAVNHTDAGVESARLLTPEQYRDMERGRITPPGLPKPPLMPNMVLSYPEKKPLPPLDIAAPVKAKLPPVPGLPDINGNDG